MSYDLAVKLVPLTMKLVLVISLVASAFAQQATEAPQGAQVAPPADAPSSQNAQANTPPHNERSKKEEGNFVQEPFGPLRPRMTKTHLTLHDKFTIYTHEAFGPLSLVFPAFGAGFSMARPHKHYPSDWVDGGGAFGRLYGSDLATQTTERTAGFLTESLSHEDPRYLPARDGAGVGTRIFHAIAFSFVDRNDSGGHTLAFSNFASAAAGGFAGIAYQPPGFNDATHAEQRAGREFLGIVVANIAKEFAPQLAPIVSKLRILRIVPVWWVPEHPQHP